MRESERRERREREREEGERRKEKERESANEAFDKYNISCIYFVICVLPSNYRESDQIGHLMKVAFHVVCVCVSVCLFNVLIILVAFPQESRLSLIGFLPYRPICMLCCIPQCSILRSWILYQLSLSSREWIRPKVILQKNLLFCLASHISRFLRQIDLSMLITILLSNKQKCLTLPREMEMSWETNVP